MFPLAPSPVYDIYLWVKHNLCIYFVGVWNTTCIVMFQLSNIITVPVSLKEMRVRWVALARDSNS